MEILREYETGTKLPSVEPLNRIILSWDFIRDISDDKDAVKERELTLIKTSLLAANRTRLEAGGLRAEGGEITLSSEPLPDRFSSEDDYINRMLPLLLIELKQSIFRAKEMEMSAPEIVVQSLAEPAAGFIQLTLTRAESAQSRIMTTDLCLLYLDPPGVFPPPLESDFTVAAPAPTDAHKSHALCVVEQSVRNVLVVKCLIPPVDAENRTDVSRLTAVARAIARPGNRWYFTRVMGMSTVNREYQALMSLPEMHLKADIVLSGEDPVAELLQQLQRLAEQRERALALPNGHQKRQTLKKLLGMEKKRQRRLQLLRERQRADTRQTLQIGQKLTAQLTALYNKGQMEALQNCLKPEGITLIQGPPGTGKTTTILGILSVILNAQVKHVRKGGKRPGSGSAENGAGQGAGDAGDDEGVSGAQGAADAFGACGDAPGASASKRQRFLAALGANQPWCHDPDYVPWYDNVRLFSEDLEKFVVKEAAATDAVLDVHKSGADIQPKRVLVCAPSNAAVDEILRRLTGDPARGGGVFNNDGDRYNPATVRVGPGVHQDLVQYSLETRVDARIQAKGNQGGAARDATKQSILAEARIVCGTLSMCGSRDLIAFSEGFDTVVIDEASQGVEIATLLPLRLGCRRLILVGDPKQLPATVFSRVALELGYDQSLFQRLEKAGNQVNMLGTQYRMHPAISAFPSEAFYDGQLADAENILKAVQPPFPWHGIPIMRPVVFFGLQSAHAAEASSLINADEAAFVLQLIDFLASLFAALPAAADSWASQIAVISPYAEQVKYIRNMLKAYFKVDGRSCPIDVNTVDGFQGREKNLVIFSAVRAEAVAEDVPDAELRTNVGFLADVRRMNVALTRARYNLWVVGNSAFLRGNPTWKKFISYCDKNNFHFNVNYASYGGTHEKYLKRWMCRFLQRSPQTRELLATYVPAFVPALEAEVAEFEAAAEAGAGAGAPTAAPVAPVPG